MNILRISRSYFPSVHGTSFHMYELNKFLVSKGHQVSYICPFWKTIPSPFRLDQINHLKIPFQNYFEGLGPKRAVYGNKLRMLFYWLSCCYGVFKAHLKTKVQLVHIHGELIDLLVIPFLCRFLKIRILLSIHARLPKTSFYQRFIKTFPYLLKSADYFHTVSQQIKEDLIDLGIPSEKIFVQSSGVSEEFFIDLPAKLENLQDIKKNLISVGRLEEMKGYEFLVKAMNTPSLKEQQLKIIGEGTLKSSLLNLKQDNTELIGGKTKKEISSLLNKSFIYLCTSIDTGGNSEGMSTSVLEALAAGMIVISTKVGDHKSYLKNIPAAWLIEQKSEAAIYDAILKIQKLSNQVITERLTNTRTIISEKKWSQVCSNICSKYKRIVEQRSLE